MLQLDEHSLLVHAQAGLTGLDLERILPPRGLSIGDYPPVVLRSSLGGLIAVRTPGKSSARHGFFEDAVVGVSAVLADGRTVHTRVAPRRATGPDLARALCGSEGTIGFITSAVLRIHLRPEARLVAAYLLPSVDAAVRAIYLALREEAAPSGCASTTRPRPRATSRGSRSRPARRCCAPRPRGRPISRACDRDLITERGARRRRRADRRRARRAVVAPAARGRADAGARADAADHGDASHIRPVYHAVLAEASRHGAAARAHVSRFDPDGAVVFFSMGQAGAPTDHATVAAAERAAQQAGGWLLGGRAEKLDAYLRALRDSLDPDRIMNPGTFRSLASICQGHAAPARARGRPPETRSRGRGPRRATRRRMRAIVILLLAVGCTSAASPGPVTTDPGGVRRQGRRRRSRGRRAIPDVQCSGTPDAGPAGSFNHISSRLISDLGSPNHRGIDLVTSASADTQTIEGDIVTDRTTRRSRTRTSTSSPAAKGRMAEPSAARALTTRATSRCR